MLEPNISAIWWFGLLLSQRMQFIRRIRILWSAPDKLKEILKYISYTNIYYNYIKSFEDSNEKVWCFNLNFEKKTDEGHIRGFKGLSEQCV